MTDNFGKKRNFDFSLEGNLSVTGNTIREGLQSLKKVILPIVIQQSLRVAIQIEFPRKSARFFCIHNIVNCQWTKMILKNP
jgi:hypothetical protein